VNEINLSPIHHAGHVVGIVTEGLRIFKNRLHVFFDLLINASQGGMIIKITGVQLDQALKNLLGFIHPPIGELHMSCLGELKEVFLGNTGEFGVGNFFGEETIEELDDVLLPLRGGIQDLALGPLLRSGRSDPGFCFAQELFY
jgi:hypothetical protein